MARFMTDFYVDRPDADQFIAYVSQDFFRKEGYGYVNFKGENLWKKGVGALAAPQFIKLEYAGGRVHLEAWLRTVWLPGVYGGEMDFNGAWGFAVKESFRGKVNQLIALLQQAQVLPNAQPVSGQAPAQNAAQGQPVSSAGGQAAAQQGPGGGNPVQPQGIPQTPQTGPDAQSAAQGQPASGAGFQPQQAVPVLVHDPKGSATLALVMGLVSILGVWVPLIGIVGGIVGIVSGRKGMRSTAKGIGTAGFVLSVVFLAVSLLVTVFNVMLVATFGYYAF